MDNVQGQELCCGPGYYELLVTPENRLPLQSKICITWSSSDGVTVLAVKLPSSLVGSE